MNTRLCYFCIKGVACIVVDTEIYTPKLSDLYLTQKRNAHGNFSNDIEISVYGTYEKAYAKFKELIADEMNPENSWVGELEWKDGVLQDDKVELDFLDRRNDTDETECYWLITDTWNYGIHTFISIEIKEVL